MTALAIERVAADAAPPADTLGTLDWAAGALPPLTPPRRDVLVAGVAVTAGRTGAVRWRDDDSFLFGEVELPDDGIEDTTRRAYADIFATLAARGGLRLLRVWNVVPRINADEAGLERYRHFNTGRQRAFAAAGADFGAGAPAASALGAPGGPLTVRFLAGRQAPLALENPRQVPAWRYSTRHGPTSPTFARAALADAGGGRVALFVSGTAAIVGEASLHAGDVRAQTVETVTNLDALLAAAGERCSAAFTRADLVCTVYLRRAADVAAVRPLLPAAAVVVQADVCRAELLIEVEAHAIRPGVLR